ncbi:hypothetical protein QA802_20800 [Streptomyces sp. B21-105]
MPAHGGDGRRETWCEAHREETRAILGFIGVKLLTVAAPPDPDP